MRSIPIRIAPCPRLPRLSRVRSRSRAATRDVMPWLDKLAILEIELQRARFNARKAGINAKTLPPSDPGIYSGRGRECRGVISACRACRGLLRAGFLSSRQRHLPVLGIGWTRRHGAFRGGGESGARQSACRGLPAYLRPRRRYAVAELVVELRSRRPYGRPFQRCGTR